MSLLRTKELSLRTARHFGSCTGDRKIQNILRTILTQNFLEFTQRHPNLGVTYLLIFDHIAFATLHGIPQVARLAARHGLFNKVVDLLDLPALQEFKACFNRCFS